MFTNAIATAFANYVRHHDSRAQELARKADTIGLTDSELEEFAVRMERLYNRFMEARRALLGRD